MQRKLSLTVLLLLLVGLGIWALDRWSVISVWPVDPEDCLPAQAGLVISLPQMGVLSGTAGREATGAWEDLMQHVPGFTEDVLLANELIDTLFPSHTFIDQARGLLSINAIDNERLGLTWLIDMRNLGNPDPVEWLDQKRLSYRTSSFRGQTVWTVQLPGRRELALAQYRNILILAHLPYQVEAVLVGAFDQENWLTELGPPSDQAGSFTIYWKAANWGDIQNSLFTAAGLSLSGNWDKWLDRARIVCTTDSAGIRMQGELLARGRFLDSPVAAGDANAELWSLLPANTSGLKLINVADNQAYFHQISSRQVSRFRRFFLPWLKGPVLELDLRPLNAELSERRLHFYGFDDGDRMQAALNDWMEEVGILRTVDYQGFLLTQVNEDQSLFPWSDGNWNNPWWTVVGSHLLVSQNRSTLENWVDQYVVGNTLPLTEVVRQITPSASGGQFYFFLDWEQWRTAWKTIVKHEQLAAALPELGQAAIRITGRGGKARLDGLWSQTQDVGEDANVLWRQRLPDLVQAGPWICTAAGGEKLILVQDRANQLFAYDANGKLRWQRQWPGRIVSPISSIPLRDRRVLVFNTRNAIYLTELDGTPIAPFPLNLRNETQQALTVVDFSENQEYSFFIVTVDGCVYGYDQAGGPIEAWSPKCNLGPIDHPLVHFQDSNRDFLLIRNTYGGVRAFARDGSTRLAEVFPGGANAMVPQLQSWSGGRQITMVSDSGLIQTLSLSGQSFQIQLPVDAGQLVEVLSKDLFGNSRPDFLLASGRHLSLYGYTNSGMVKRFEKQFPQTVAQIFTPAATVQEIGILLEPAERIYLLDNKGDVLPGFPLAGSTPFLMTDLFQTGEQQFVAGYRDELIVYQVEQVN